MAHQAHNIPWRILASNFHYVPFHGSYNNVTNLYPNLKPTQGKELDYFVEAFVKTIEEHSRGERDKYSESYEVPAPDDILLSDALVDKLAPLARRIRLTHEGQEDDSRTYREQPCPHRLPQDPECRCAIPFEERKTEAFLRPRVDNECYRFLAENGPAFFNLDIAKALVLHGQMEPLLRVCARPDVQYLHWWSARECYDMPADIGLDQVAKMALSAYLCLNVLYCKPELWDFGSGRAPDRDYRLTHGYQRMVRECTMSHKRSTIATYPHRQFFGIASGHFKDSREPWEMTISGNHNGLDGKMVFPYGQLSAEAFLSHDTSQQTYLATMDDVHTVRGLLRKTGLPAELALAVMEAADYVPRRRLAIPHDPLHLDNAGELMHYLKYSWQVLVRCDMLVRELGDTIPWHFMIASCIVDLWGVSYHNSYAYPSSPPKPGSMYTILDSDGDGRWENSLLAPREKIKFL